MAIHITMNKEFEDAKIVVYQYYPSESPEKVIFINKSSKNIDNQIC
ncbi:hypothetical protein [Bacillus bingmayongensis]|nr:hypothetical protein [Bacillus bingmayongensis]MBY0598725.1 hypothetical protein [Bacillus bingmayongensis]